MFDPARLVFIDETSANTKMARLYGRCDSGERLVRHVPQGHWKRSPWWRRCDGMACERHKPSTAQ